MEEARNPTSDAAEFPQKVRWTWVITGILLLIFGVSLPYFATIYYSNYGNSTETGAPRIPVVPGKVKASDRKQTRSAEVARDISPVSACPAKQQHPASPEVVPASAAIFAGSASPVEKPVAADPDGPGKDRNIFKRIYDFFTRLFRKKKPRAVNQPPNVTAIGLSSTRITRACPPGWGSVEKCNGEDRIEISAAATDPEGDAITYTYMVSGGRIVGTGADVTWDVAGLAAGTYSVTAGAADGQGARGQTQTGTITVSECEDCANPPPCGCPEITIAGGGNQVEKGEKVVLTASISPGDGSFTYRWSLSCGSIASGQGTPRILVDTTNIPGTLVTATLEVGGFYNNCGCPATASANVYMYEVWASCPTGYIKVNGVCVPGASNANTGFPTPNPTPTGTPERMPTPTPPATPTPPPTPATLPTRPPENAKASTTNTGALTNSSKINANAAGNGNTAANTNIANSTGNINVGGKTKGSDKLSYDYPKYILKDTTHIVNLHLEYVEGQVVTSATTTTTNTIVTNSIVQPVFIPEASEDLDIYVIATLTPVSNLNASVVPGDGGWKKYEKIIDPAKGLSWQWEMTLDKAVKDPKEAACEIRLDYGFKRKDAPAGSLPVDQGKAWQKDLTMEVGLPWSIWLLTMLSVPGGALLSFAGFMTKKNVIDVPPPFLPPVLTGPGVETVAADTVQCTLYSPEQAKPGSDFQVLVFAHLAGQAAGLAEIAAETDEDLRQQAAKELQKPVERGSLLTFELMMSGVEIDEPVQQHAWRGNIVEVPFIVSLPRDTGADAKMGKVVVSENGVPIGRLTFKIAIAAKPGAAQSTETFKPYRTAFISYASEDRVEVVRRVQALQAAQINCLQDVLDFSPGERWERKIYLNIDRSDVVFLFWSEAARRSPWVEKEILYALDRQHGVENAAPDIIPIMLEGPPPVPPPSSLSFLHFNDKFVYLIHAMDVERERRHQPDPK